MLLLVATAGTFMPVAAATAVDVCGNGKIVKAAGETCDDGNLNDGDELDLGMEVQAGMRKKWKKKRMRRLRRKRRKMRQRAR